MTYIIAAIAVLISGWIITQSRSGEATPAVFALGIGIGIIIGGLSSGLG